jgi:ATP-dependent RNA circularization protein (DNA/RNA ligase family)
MKPYHKIQTVFERDPETKYRTVLVGEFALPEFEYLANNTWAFTEKVDGTNIRIDWDGAKITLGGRTDNAQIPAFLVERLYELFKPEKLAALAPMTFYGEGYGAKIQKGGNYKADGVDFVLFDIFCGLWLKREDVEDIASQLSIAVVPVIETGTLPELTAMVKAGFRSAWGEFLAEGIVARPRVDLYNRQGERIITKLKHKDFPR